MAVSTALLTRNRVFAAKIEGTTGTPEALTAAEGLYNIFDMKLEATIPATEREGQGNLSPLNPVPGARTAKATFKTEVVGSGTGGTDPKWLSVLLKTCGFTGSGGTYTPLTGASATATMASYIGGRVLTASGCMGKVTIDLEVGKPGMLSYEYQGVWQPPTSATLLTPNYPVVIPPRVASCTFTLGGTAYRVPKISISIDNTLYMREDIGTASGYLACMIPNRKITVKLSPEALPLTTEDFFAAHLSGSSFALNLVVGSVSGNQFTFAAPNLIQLDPPGYEDANGLYRDSLTFLACRSSSGGDDELSIAAS